MILTWLEHLRRRHTLRHHAIPRAIWRPLMQQARLFQTLSAVEKAHLKVLATLFLHRKHFIGAQGLTVSPFIAAAVSAQACLPILKLGLRYYDGWQDVVIYPQDFQVRRDVMDETGVVTHEETGLAGESWLHGPVILSWETVAADLSNPQPGHNLVVHEFAHKLDMLNGAANGMPPLRHNMIREQWTQVFSKAFSDLQLGLRQRQPVPLDAYATSSPAEFFAVCSEYFFTDPGTLIKHFPAVYQQLALFYQQDPHSRYHRTDSAQTTGD